VKLLREGHVSLATVATFSSEGGLFVGGHVMIKEARLRTVSGLCLPKTLSWMTHG
jgi:hypothetical protein